MCAMSIQRHANWEHAKRDIDARHQSVMIDLARRDLEFFRKKYAAVPQLSSVMNETDSFLAATASEVAREVVEA